MCVVANSMLIAQLPYPLKEHCPFGGQMGFGGVFFTFHEDRKNDKLSAQELKLWLNKLKTRDKGQQKKLGKMSNKKEIEFLFS